MIIKMRIFLIPVWLIFIQLFFTGVTYGQVNQDDSSILVKVVRQLSLQQQIIYVDTVRGIKDESEERLINIIRNGVIQDWASKDVLVLTKAEQNYILNQLRQQTVWPDNLFPNGKRIEEKSMWNYLRQMESERILSMNNAALQKDTATYNSLRNNYTYIFTFAKPIYIRDNTICLIAFGAMCGGMCGRTETCFYKKENNEWIKWIMVSAGDF